MAQFADHLAWGQVAESHIARWLRFTRGYSVLPVYQMDMPTGKGPQIFSASTSFVAPDFLAWKGADARWIEAKCKSVFSWYRLGRCWVTGIDIRHYENYCAIDAQGPWPVYLLFLHLSNVPAAHDRKHGCPPACPTGLFTGKLSALKTRESHRSDRHGRSGMVYWDERHLVRITSASAVVEASRRPVTIDATWQGAMFREDSVTPPTTEHTCQ